METDLKILDVMKAKGMSIEALKTKIEENGEHLSRTSISKIIHHKSVPKIDTLQIIADALDVSVHRLLDTKDRVIHLILDNRLRTFRSLEALNAYLKSIA